jgi:hypothetical protein
MRGITAGRSFPAPERVVIRAVLSKIAGETEDKTVKTVDSY